MNVAWLVHASCRIVLGMFVSRADLGGTPAVQFIQIVPDGFQHPIRYFSANFARLQIVLPCHICPHAVLVVRDDKLQKRLRLAARVVVPLFQDDHGGVIWNLQLFEQAKEQEDQHLKCVERLVGPCILHQPINWAEHHPGRDLLFCLAEFCVGCYHTQR